jgi:hypothetical protein
MRFLRAGWGSAWLGCLAVLLLLLLFLPFFLDLGLVGQLVLARDLNQGFVTPGIGGCASEQG